jgi:type I restriction enzyme, R subunit
VTTPGRDWTEENLVEIPAVERFQKLGWTYHAPDLLDFERSSYHEVILAKRLGAALQKLNPWISDENVQKAIRAVTHVQATSLIEANEKLHTILTYGISLEQDRGDGRRNYPVHFIDFDRPWENDLIVTRQFKVKGSKKHVIADVVLFVNGIPLVIIEAKSPTLGEKWLPEAVDQLLRYQEVGDGFNGMGAPRLFETAQVLVVTCLEQARYGTILTPQRYYFGWKVPYPLSADDLKKELGKTPNRQELLMYGLLTPENLLDIVRNFIAFERDPKTGRTVKKLCRYQQYAAVNKALDRARTVKKPSERGGVVWHTQGSGKSLTMLWLALKLRRDPLHDNPTLVIVTDRIDLDEQITGTFQRCGFPNPVEAESVRHLNELLTGPPGLTVLTTVQKFQQLGEGSGNGSRRVDRGEFPVLSTATNIFVLADEAHRTQYGGLAASMRQALPNAAFLGFTGTPIDKQDRSTLTTFGPYIDTYTIEQSVADGATVPIFYESRLPELRIVGQSLDKIFDHVFADRTPEEREAIKKRYGTEEAIAGAPKRIEAICLDLIDHFTKFIYPNGFKAQIVTPTRDAAVTYKETLDKLNAPQSAIVISGSNDDKEDLVRWHSSGEAKKKTIGRFLKEDDPLAILVVCDMLLTGFDAPVEQVMYLDSSLKEHSLLQAIARVNRPCGDKKTYGLIVDYWGVSEALQEALAIFSPTDIKGALNPKGDELPRLQARHAAVLRFFQKVRDKNDLDQCVAVLEPEDTRAEFEAAFRRFAQSMDMVMPDPKALPYYADVKWLGKVRQTARARFQDTRMDISDCGEKVRKLIEEAIVAEGIEILVQKVSLLSKEFDEKVDALKSDEAKASEMEHAIRAEIHVRLEENPAFYTSLKEQLERIIEDRKASRIEQAKQLELLKSLIVDLKNEAGAAEKLGLSENGFAIFGVLAKGPEATGDKVSETVASWGTDDSRKELASLIEEAVEPFIDLVDWIHKADIERQLRQQVKRQLRAAQCPSDRIEPVTASVVDLLKARQGSR